MTMSDTITTPWSDELVKCLNEQQISGMVHPYTCDYCRDNLGVWFVLNKKTGEKKRVSVCYNPSEDEQIFYNDRILIATKDGWVCPTCNNKQNWCFNPSAVVAGSPDFSTEI